MKKVKKTKTKAKGKSKKVVKKKSKVAKKKSKKRGFTLIEMLIVIAIIGILIGAILYNVTRGRKKALALSMKTAVSEIYKSVEIAATENCSSIGVKELDPLVCDTPAGNVLMAKVPSPPKCPSCGYGAGKDAATASVASISSGRQILNPQDTFSIAVMAKSFVDDDEYYACSNDGQGCRCFKGAAESPGGCMITK